MRFPTTLLVLVACGCGAPAPQPSPPTAVGGEGVSAATSTAISTATPTATPTTLLRAATAIEPSARIALSPGAEVVVDPHAKFEVELSARSPDARLVLLDAREDFVAAASAREIGSVTRLTLVPNAPLVSGSRYALRLDGATERDLHDEAGRAFGPISLPLLAAGTPPPPEPKKPARKKRHR